MSEPKKGQKNSITPGGGKFWVGALLITGIGIAAGSFLRERAINGEAVEIAGAAMAQRVGYGSGLASSSEHEEEVIGMNDAGALLSTEALQCLCEFIDARDIAHRSEYVADSANVLPAMEEYYAKFPPKRYKEDDFLPLTLPVNMIRDELAAYTVRPNRAPNPEQSWTYPCEVEALLLFVRDPATSKFQLDWHTYNQTKHKRMVKYFERPREETAVFRMSLALATEPDQGGAGDAYYEFDASDLGITGHTVSLYVSENSPQIASLRAGLDNGTRERIATVEVCWNLDNQGISRPSIRELVSWGLDGTGWDDGGAQKELYPTPVANVSAR